MSKLNAILKLPMVVAAAVALALGCNSLPSPRAEGTLSPETAASVSPPPLKIVYRTKTDRLTSTELPSCSMATLQIQGTDTHRNDNTGYARLTVLPLSADPNLTPGDLSTNNGHPTPTVWRGEIPMWQLEAIVGQLEQAHFFRRAKIFGAETFLSVSTSSRRLGRPYREVAELDAIILRMSQSESNSHGPAPRPELARLPALPTH